MDHIQQFQQEMARMRQERLMSQKTSPFAPVHAKAYANLPEYHNPVKNEEPATLKNIVPSIKEIFGEDDFFRFNYVGAVVNNVIGFIAEYTYNLLIMSGLHGPGTKRFLEDLYDQCRFLFGRYSRDGEKYIEAIKCLRFNWFEQDRMGQHITNIKNAYLDYIINSKYAYRDHNANDLMAWVYTALSLSDCSFRFLEQMQALYNSRVSDPKMKMVIKKQKFQDEYGVCHQLEKFISMCKFPKHSAISSRSLTLALDVFVNQCRMVPFNKYYQQQLRLAQLEGKTIRLA